MKKINFIHQQQDYNKFNFQQEDCNKFNLKLHIHQPPIKLLSTKLFVLDASHYNIIS